MTVTLHLTAADFQDGAYVGTTDLTQRQAGDIEIAPDLGTVTVPALWCTGSIRVGSGTDLITAAGSITADRDITAAGSITADRDIDAAGSITADRYIDAAGGITAGGSITASRGIGAGRYIDAAGGITCRRVIHGTAVRGNLIEVGR